MSVEPELSHGVAGCDPVDAAVPLSSGSPASVVEVAAAAQPACTPQDLADAASPRSEGQPASGDVVCTPTKKRVAINEGDAGKDEPTSPGLAKGKVGRSFARHVAAQSERGVLHVLLDQLVKFGIIMLACSPFIGGIAWAVPNALCKVPMEQSMANGGGGSGGFFDCLYMKHMDWKGAPTLTTLLMLFWAITYTYSAMAPTVALIAIFGIRKFTRREIVSQSVMAVLMCAITVGCILSGIDADTQGPLGRFRGGYVVLQYALSGAMVTRMTGEGKLLGIQYFLCWIALAGITFMYSMILPTIITARATVPQLGIFAFVVHPAMFGALTFMFRFLVQKVKIRELRSVNLITVPLYLSTLYAQFLLLQLNNAGSTFVIRAIILMGSLAMKLLIRSNGAQQLITTEGKRVAEVMQATREDLEDTLAEDFSFHVADMLSVVANTLFYCLGNVASAPGQLSSAWSNVNQALVQLLVIALQIVLGLLIDRYVHQVPVAELWSQMKPRTIAFFTAALCLGLVGEVPKLFLLFCPKYYPETGVILEYCNKPSLAQFPILLNQRINDSSPGLIQTKSLIDGTLLYSSLKL